MAYGNLKADNLIYADSTTGADTVVPLEHVGGKAPLNSPVFTGTPTVPGYAPLDSPALIGTATGVNLTLSGDLTVDGTTTTINTTNLDVEDKNITLGKVTTPTDTTADGGGITLKGGTDKTITWANSTDTWDFNQGIIVGGNPSNATAIGARISNEGYFHAARADAAYTLWAGYTQGTNTITSQITAGGATTFHRTTWNGTGGANCWEVYDGATCVSQITYDGTYRSGSISGASANILLTGSTGNIAVTGSVSDSKGDVRSIPANHQSTAYQLVVADAGKHVLNTAAVTVPASVFTTGDAVTIINGSGSNIDITQGTSVTIYNTADGTTGSRVLAGRGMATLLFVNSTDCYISGAGLS